ncbi:PqiC family protein [Alcaligenaceae bacterium CGII-47]|nr:PqiC family protein [Alcaligenaceae bacterium CGII-47]
MVLCIMGLVLLTACTSTPTRYYSLAPTPSHPQAAPKYDAAPDFAIRMGQVRVPAEVDRPQLVVRGDSSTAVTVLNQSVWAAPLADQIQAGLAQALMQVLAVPDVSFVSAPAHLPVWTIAVQIHRFELMTGAWTLLDASWTLGQPPSEAGSQDVLQPGAATQICRAVIHRPVLVEGVEPLVESQRNAVTSLADAIAASISTRRLPPAPSTEIDKGCTYT